MAAVRYLGFVVRVFGVTECSSWVVQSLDHPRRAFCGLYHCAKCGWNRCSSFDNIRIIWFREFDL